MKRLLAMVLVAVGINVSAEEKAANSDLELFNGTWKCVSIVRDGKEVPKAEAEAVRLIVAGEKYSLKQGGDDVEGTHKLDATKKPKEIDAVRSKGPNKGEKLVGIYELTADKFTVCFAPAGKSERPKELKSESGSGHRLLSFKREKQ